MPYAYIQVIKGASRDQKRKLVEEITNTICAVLDKKPEYTHIVIQEIEEENWGFDGMLTNEWRQQKKSSE